MDLRLILCQHTYDDNGEVCNKPVIGHGAVERSDGRLSIHDFVRPTFTDQDATFEVWEVADGKFLRLVSSDLPEDRARYLAGEWTAEYVAAGRTGRGFLPVEVTVKRRLAVRIDDMASGSR